MGRPSLEPGRNGSITLTPQARLTDDASWSTAHDHGKRDKLWLPDETGDCGPNCVRVTAARMVRWRARSTYRDEQGRRREMARFAPTMTAARADLDRALANRPNDTTAAEQPRTSGWREDMPTGEAIDLYVARAVKRDGKPLAQRTRDLYAYGAARYLHTADLAQRPLLSLSGDVSAVEAHLAHLAATHGTGAAKLARSILSGTMTEARRNHVRLPYNSASVAGVPKGERTRGADREHDRSLTVEQRDSIVAWAYADDRAGRYGQDVADLVQLLAHTGVRMGEALALTWDQLDLEKRRLRVLGTKTEGSKRTLPMTPELVARFTARRATLPTATLVFPPLRLPDSTNLRSRRNVDKEVRRVLVESGHEWAPGGHVFRRTIATLLTEQGVPIHKVSAWLGHKDISMTQRHYLDRTDSGLDQLAGLI